MEYKLNIIFVFFLIYLLSDIYIDEIIDIRDDIKNLLKIISNSSISNINLYNEHKSIFRCLDYSNICIVYNIIQFPSIILFLNVIEKYNCNNKKSKVSNKINTCRYSNTLSLICNELIKYLYSIPNLITLSIGIIQAYSTTYYINIIIPIKVKILLNLSIYSTLLYYKKKFRNSYSILLFLIYLRYISITRISLYLIRGNYINILVSLLCLSFAIFREYDIYNITSKLDELYNGSMIRVLKDNNYKYIRSDNIKLTDIIKLEYNECIPASIEVLSIKCTNKSIDVDDRCDYNIGTYYDRISSGENVSRQFTIGSILPEHRLISRPYTEIIGKVNKYVLSPEINKGSTLPNYLNTSRTCSDIIGLCIILLLAIIVSASAISNNNVDLSVIFRHLLAFSISVNVLIPSMKMSLLYNVYNLLLSLIFNDLTVNNYDIIPKFSNLNAITFDKTGTLTEECLSVSNCYNYDMTNLNTIACILNWNIEEVECALSLANNESNIHKGEIWGMSPEECEILKYLTIKYKKFQVINPLNTKGILHFSIDNGIERYIKIIERNNYIFGKGKISYIELQGLKNIKLCVRQDGSSFLADQLQYLEKKWVNEIEITDPKRSISISYNILSEYSNKLDETNWRILSVYSFENPLREGIPELIRNSIKRGLRPCILTGDGLEAAEEVGKSCGLIVNNVYRILENMNLKDVLKYLKKNNKCVISVEGKVIEKWINDENNTNNINNINNNLISVFLNYKCDGLIICRASKTIKEKVSKLINKGCYIGDAANDSLAIQSSYIGIALRHGAEICKIKSDLILNSPSNLDDILCENGYRDMLLVGGERLLEDVCYMGGLTAGCLVIGIYNNDFRFLSDSILYIDAWKPLPMLIISSIEYTLSVIGYSSSNCNSSNYKIKQIITSSTYWHIVGLFIGFSVGFIVKTKLNMYTWSTSILHILDILILLKHSYHCFFIDKKQVYRIYNGLLGNQIIPENSKYKKIGICLNIMDSIPFRILLYVLFILLPIW